MKRTFVLVLIVLCTISLFGCSKDNSETIQNEIPADVSSITDFKCICSIDGETEFVIEGDAAKDLYSFVTEIWNQSEQTEYDLTERSYIYLTFQDGDPIYVLGQEPGTDIYTLDDIADAQESTNHFYGVFWISENDYMVFTAMPYTSFQKNYKLPKGTYEKVLEMLKPNN